MGVGSSSTVTILENLKKGIDDTRTITESNDNVISRSLVVPIIELIGIVTAATKSTLTATVLFTNLELGKMILATSIGIANEPVGSLVDDNVHEGNVTLRLANAELLGTLEGLEYGHDRFIFLKQLDEGIDSSRHIGCENGGKLNRADM